MRVPKLTMVTFSAPPRRKSRALLISITTHQAEHVGSETVLARIIQMVADAQRSRAPIQALADKVSGRFVPAVLACSGADLHRVGFG